MTHMAHDAPHALQRGFIMNWEKQKSIFTGLSCFIIFSIIACFILFRNFGMIAPFACAALFAMLMNPLAEFLHRHLKLNRKICAVLAVFIVFGILCVFLFFCVTEAYFFCKDTLTEFLNNPTCLDRTMQGLHLISKRLHMLLPMDFDLTKNVKNMILPAAQWMIRAAGSFTTFVPQMFVSVAVCMAASFFLVTDQKRISAFFLSHLNPRHLQHIKKLKKIAQESVLSYGKAQLILMGITFVELLVGFCMMNWMEISHLHHVFLLALGTAALDALPLFGTGAVLLPWSVMKAAAGELSAAIALLILYVICIGVRQLIEPKIIGESLGIHPLISLFSMYIGLRTMGVAGMILFPFLALFAVRLYQTADAAKKG